MGWMGMGLGWKSLKALILRAPLCGANNINSNNNNNNNNKHELEVAQIVPH